jgi:hypothetical protein
MASMSPHRRRLRSFAAAVAPTAGGFPPQNLDPRIREHQTAQMAWVPQTSQGALAQRNCTQRSVSQVL